MTAFWLNLFLQCLYSSYPFYVWKSLLLPNLYIFFYFLFVLCRYIIGWVEKAVKMSINVQLLILTCAPRKNRIILTIKIKKMGLPYEERSVYSDSWRLYSSNVNASVLMWVNTRYISIKPITSNKIGLYYAPTR